MPKACLGSRRWKNCFGQPTCEQATPGGDLMPPLDAFFYPFTVYFFPFLKAKIDMNSPNYRRFINFSPNFDYSTIKPNYTSSFTNMVPVYHWPVSNITIFFPFFFTSLLLHFYLLSSFFFCPCNCKSSSFHPLSSSFFLLLLLHLHLLSSLFFIPTTTSLQVSSFLLCSPIVIFLFIYWNCYYNVTLFLNCLLELCL